MSYIEKTEQKESNPTEKTLFFCYRERERVTKLGGKCENVEFRETHVGHGVRGADRSVEIEL